MKTLMTVALVCVTSLAYAADRKIVVTGSGTKGEPLTVEPGGLTFAGALERIRGLRAKGESAPVRVKVRGVNRIRETLVFGPEDHDIEFVGEDGAVLSGGVALSDWKDVGDGVWEAEAPRAADGRHLSFDQLWVNGRRAARARYPDEGYLRICAKGIRAVTNGEGRVTYVERVKAADGRFGEFAKLTADELSEAQLCAVHKWSFARRILRGFADGMVETHSPSDWNGWQTWSTNETLVAFENVPFAFDAAGEWLSDMRSGRIRYRPLPGERMESLEAVVPVPGLSRLVDFRGRCDGGKIRNVSFRNISFLHSAATRDSSRAILDEHPGVFCAVPDDGRTESWQHQAASGSDGAITLQGAAGVSFENCTVAHTGNYAFRLNDGCVSNAIVSCALRDLGAGGVWMGEGFRYQDMRGKFSRRIIRPDRPESTAFNLVSNCTIVCGGRYNPEGTGVAVTHCSDSRIVHNDIGDFYYTGVSVGWTWGYSGSVAQRNEIGWNRIWDLGKRVMSDMGGVYTLATSFGTRVHHNIIHDVWGYTYGGWALYTDEGSEGIVMEDNVCWNTTDGGFHQHYGVGCIIRNNIFAFNRERGAVRATRAERDGLPCSLHFVNNIVAVDHGPLVCAKAQKVEGVWANNLWYDYRGKDAAVFGGLGWDEWVRSGKESGSRFADPKFRDPKAFDFTLEADSPAFQLGFRPFSLATAGACGPTGEAPRFVRKTTLCHDGWSFALDASKTCGVETVEGTLAWKPVTLPYDWAIHGDWLPETGGDKLPWKESVGWYRKAFDLGEVVPGKSVFLDFDGVMAHAAVYLNGHVVGKGEYGYLGFRCDLTPHLRTGRNVILVRADTIGMNSRWYPGAGIEKRVRWTETGPVRLAHESVYVTTPEVTAKRARVRVEGEVENASAAASEAVVSVVLLAPDGRAVAERRLPPLGVRAASRSRFATELEVADPVLWELVDPAPLYTVKVAVRSPGCEDVECVRTGLRAFAFAVDDGFHLNGRRVQLNGVDLHTDMGILGMEFNRGVMRRQLKRMRDMGANALRTSHNAQSPELLDLCDEMGIFVWNECFDKWDATCGRGSEKLETFVERQLGAWTRRDRNHPSVFAWSIGNEIHSSLATPKKGPNGTTGERCARFREAVRSFDRTRPVGIGSCFSGDVVKTGDYDCLDITGWNYGRQYETYRRHMPGKPVLYTESASCVSSAGYYAETLPTNKIQFAVKDREVDSMDMNSAPWSDIPDKEFERMERDTHVGGEFVWTGIDYLGEPYPYMHYLDKEIMKLPVPELARSAYFGICDLLAFPKDRFYLYRSHWNRKDFTLHIAPRHWNFRAGAKRPVFVYTSADEAELFLNGRSLGRRAKDRTVDTLQKAKDNTDAWGGSGDFSEAKHGYYRVCDRYRLRWFDVPWEPGELTAVAYGKDGRELGRKTIRTAGEPVAVKVEPEETHLPGDGETLVFVRVALVDAKGTEVPNRKDFVKFAISGPGEIRAVGNADPRQCRRRFDQVDGHWLYFGQAGLVVRRTPGTDAPITLTASVDGLKSGAFTFAGIGSRTFGDATAPSTLVWLREN